MFKISTVHPIVYACDFTKDYTTIPLILKGWQLISSTELLRPVRSLFKVPLIAMIKLPF